MQSQFTAEDIAILNGLETIPELLIVAERILTRMQDPIMICGPMTTGGKGNLAANMRYYDAAVAEAALRGKQVFYQGGFQDAMIDLLPNFEETQKTKEGRFICTFQLIAEFYFPLFRMGYIKEFYMLPNWESSAGSRMEVTLAEGMGQPKVLEYPVSWLPNVKRRYEELCRAKNVPA